MSVSRVPASACRRCGTKNDAASGPDEKRPTPGAVSICWRCGTVALFADDLSLRAPTVEEVNELLDDPGIAGVLDRLWADRLAAVTADEGVVFACGCRTSSGGELFTLQACEEACAAAQTVIRAIKSTGKPLSIIR